MSYYVNPHGHSCPWYPYAELFGAPNIKWCEQTLCQWVSEPANTWSNAIYLIMAIFLFWSASRTKQFELLWFAPAMFIMGLFSLIYHMSNNYLTQVLDFIGMFLFVYWIIILNLRRLKWITAKNQILTFVIMSVASTIILHIFYQNFIKIQLIIVGAAFAIFASEALCYSKAKSEAKSEKSSAVRYDFYLFGALFIALAQTASLLDLARVSWICNPENHWFQGHALWHILSAIGLTFIYKHYEQFSFSSIDDYKKHNLKSDDVDDIEVIEDIETQLEV